MCSEVIAPSTGACLPLVGSGSTRQEISSAPTIQITFQQLPSSPLREEFMNVKAAQRSQSRWAFIANALPDFNRLILDFQVTATRKSSAEIKLFLSSSHYNSSKLQFILQCVKSQGDSFKIASPLESGSRGVGESSTSCGKQSACQSQQVYLSVRAETKPARHDICSSRV